jgi:hypothetical protein
MIIDTEEISMTNKIVKGTIINWFIVVDTNQPDLPLRLAGQREDQVSPTAVFISSPLIGVPKDGMVETENSFYQLGEPVSTIDHMITAYALSLHLQQLADQNDDDQQEMRYN